MDAREAAHRTAGPTSSEARQLSTQVAAGLVRPSRTSGGSPVELLLGQQGTQDGGPTNAPLIVSNVAILSTNREPIPLVPGRLGTEDREVRIKQRLGKPIARGC